MCIGEEEMHEGWMRRRIRRIKGRGKKRREAGEGKGRERGKMGRVLRIGCRSERKEGRIDGGKSGKKV